IECDGHPELLLVRELMRWGEHTDHRVWVAVQRNHATDDAWVAGEPPLPQGVAQEDDPLRTRPTLLFPEIASLHGAHSEEPKHVPGDQFALEPVRLVCAGEVERLVVVGSHVRECAAL